MLLPAMPIPENHSPEARPISSLKSMCLAGLASWDHPNGAQWFILAPGVADLDMHPSLLVLTGLSP